jgi:putative SOS response-associated peptidase YedK
MLSGGQEGKGSAPVGLTLPIRDWTPVILDPDAYELWLDPWMKEMGSASELLKPCDARPVRCYP